MIRDFAAVDGVLVRARERTLPVAVVLIAALAAWSATEALWQWTGPPWPEGSLTLAVLWAIAIALPLPFARRAPLLAALAVVALVVARDVAGYRAPGSVAHSVILLVALFAVEANGERAQRALARGARRRRAARGLGRHGRLRRRHAGGRVARRLRARRSR